MFSASLKAMLAVLLFFTFSVPGSRAQMPSNMDADTAAIKQTVAMFQDTWNKHDAGGLAMMYLEDGDFSNVRGEPSHGRKELEQHYTTIFTTFLKNAHSSDTVRSIRFLSPELASVDLDWRVMDPAAPGGVFVKGLVNWVVVKRNGKWMIAIYHETSF